MRFVERNEKDHKDTAHKHIATFINALYGNLSGESEKCKKVELVRRVSAISSKGN
jgi:hypothetical protein